MLALAAFGIGVLVGLCLPVRVEIRPNGKGSLVNPRRLLRSTSLGVTLVVLALLANMVAGLLLLTTRADVREQSDRLEDLTACQERYNREQGEALDARNAVSARTLRIEARLWRNLRAVLSEPIETTSELLETIDAYLAALDRVRAARNANAYPDPDACRRLTP